MRLTLRTMLAYLDNVLDAGDAAVLGKKIEESEFASDLVSRIRAAISQQRLSAPAVDGKGVGGDPNSVAEYLDSTLPPDRVPDFERVCLESDGHLAEVAACHQILTLVLGKPAAVPPALRERVYRFGSTASQSTRTRVVPAGASAAGEAHRLDNAHRATAAQAGVDITSARGAATEPAAEAATAAPSGRRTEVPEYLREGRRQSRLFTLAVSACVLLVLAGLGGLAAIQFLPPAEVAENEPPETGTPEPTPPSPDAAAPTPRGTEKPAPAGEQPATPPAARDTEAGANRPATLDGEIPPAIEPAPDVTPSPEITPAPEAPATALPTEDPVPATVDPPPVTPPAEESNNDSGSPVPAETPLPPPTIPLPPEVTPAPEPPPAEVSPVDVGRYLSGDKILARLDANGQWMRLTANTPIRSGDRVLALPAYRPQIALASGITLTLDGPTRLEFRRPGTEGEPQVDLKYGRLMAITVAAEGSPLGIRVLDMHGTARLSDGNTILAVEAAPFRAAGTDPEQVPPQLDVAIICLAGRVDWIGDDGNAAPILAGEQLTMVGGTIGQVTKFDAPPAWVDDKAVSPLDRDAARTLEPRLEADRPLSLTLSEYATGNRADLRSLAVRSLAYLDHHNAFIGALNDNSQRSSWADELNAVHHALARGSDSAAAVRKAFEKERGGAAQELYRLTWGYSQEDLINGADAKLVEYLDHDAQEFRVLAIENLRRITDATHLYRPEYNPQRRKMYVQTWRRDLEEGKIRYPNGNTPGT